MLRTPISTSTMPPSKMRRGAMCAQVILALGRPPASSRTGQTAHRHVAGAIAGLHRVVVQPVGQRPLVHHAGPGFRVGAGLALLVAHADVSFAAQRVGGVDRDARVLRQPEADLRHVVDGVEVGRDHVRLGDQVFDARRVDVGLDDRDVGYCLLAPALLVDGLNGDAVRSGGYDAPLDDLARPAVVAERRRRRRVGAVQRELIVLSRGRGWRSRIRSCPSAPAGEPDRDRRRPREGVVHDRGGVRIVAHHAEGGAAGVDTAQQRLAAAAACQAEQAPNQQHAEQSAMSHSPSPRLVDRARAARARSGRTRLYRRPERC